MAAGDMVKKVDKGTSMNWRTVMMAMYRDSILHCMSHLNFLVLTHTTLILIIKVKGFRFTLS